LGVKKVKKTEKDGGKTEWSADIRCVHDGLNKNRQLLRRPGNDIDGYLTCDYVYTYPCLCNICNIRILNSHSILTWPVQHKNDKIKAYIWLPNDSPEVLHFLHFTAVLFAKNTTAFGEAF